MLGLFGKKVCLYTAAGIINCYDIPERQLGNLQNVQGTRTSAHPSRALAPLLDDLSSAPNIHIGWLTTTCNPNSRGANASGLGRQLHLRLRVQTRMDTNTFNLKTKL